MAECRFSCRCYLVRKSRVRDEFPLALPLMRVLRTEIQVKEGGGHGNCVAGDEGFDGTSRRDGSGGRGVTEMT